MPNNNQSEEVDLVGGIAEKMMFLKSRELDEKHYPFTKKLTDDEYTNFRDTIRQTLTTHGASEYARGKSEERERIEKVMTAMSWRQKNETSEAIRVLFELRQALSQENTLKE